MIRQILIALSIGLAVNMLVVTSVFGASNPSGTGQPTQSCGSDTAAQMPPGFGTDGFTRAALVYAGSDGTPSQQNAQSTHVVSQYDVACYQVSQIH